MLHKKLKSNRLLTFKLLLYCNYCYCACVLVRTLFSLFFMLRRVLRQANVFPSENASMTFGDEILPYRVYTESIQCFQWKVKGQANFSTHWTINYPTLFSRITAGRRDMKQRRPTELHLLLRLLTQYYSLQTYIIAVFIFSVLLN